MYTKNKFDSQIRIIGNDALLVIDMQNDFLPRGSLAVTDGDTIITGINNLRTMFSHNNQIVFTQDWHPADHQTFASAHSDKKPFDEYSSPGLGPVLWPDHCIQGSKGAEFASSLDQNLAKMILRKGYHKEIDSYSAFLENDKTTFTGLNQYLKAFNVTRVFICGLALDYCVKYSALDAQKLGFDVFVILDLTKAVKSPEDSVSNALQDMVDNQVAFVTSDQILE